jgi:heterodisulfide reductase subunit A-like polyferredoxin
MPPMLVQQTQACGMNIARRTSIAIIGGGIGGLTAAASLLHAGFDAHVMGRRRHSAKSALALILVLMPHVFCIGLGLLRC